MDALHQEEPNSEVWFGFALIAEHYGVLDAAEKMYSRVEKPKLDYPGTSYVIAQQHLTVLRGNVKNSTKAAGQQWTPASDHASWSGRIGDCCLESAK